MTKKELFPLISVIIPVYNAEKYIERCLDSVIDQTYTNIEIIVVDDGSTDGSAEICNRYAREDERIKVIHKVNGGLVAARKTGIRIAAGEYVTYVDDDDWIETNMYEELIQEAICNNADIVTSGLFRDYKNSTVMEHDYLSEGVYGANEIKRDVITAFMYAGDFYKAGISIHLHNKIYKRELVLRNQLKVKECIKAGEDAALVYPCILEAEKIVVTYKCFYHYCIRQNSKSMMEMEYQEGLEGYKATYSIIRDAIETYGEQKDTLMVQLNYLMLYLLLLKDPQLVIKQNKSTLFPFVNVKIKEKVILYGGGRFGCSLYRFLSKTGLCEVVLWVDKSENPEKGIVSPSKLAEMTDLEYNKVLISVLDAKVADEICGELQQISIDENKIAKVDCGEVEKDFWSDILG